MIYQRHIPKNELFCAQLEMLMQNGQLATVSFNAIGALATMVMFWPFVELTMLFLWGAAFLILLLLRSLHMSNALAKRTFLTKPRSVYWGLLLGAAATGAVWSSVYIFATLHVPVTMQYTFLLLIVMITTISVGFSIVIREYVVAFLFTAIWPIAWWTAVHYWEEPYNLMIGLVLLAFCGLLVVVCDRVSQSFSNTIALDWERATMMKELGALTSSLRSSNRQLRDARRQLTDLANVDELTGLGNRRLVNSSLKIEVNRARRSGAHLSIILLDVDYFKNYNDTHGHPAGDIVLQRLAELMLRATNRAGEVVARYGGEEFILVLPGSDARAAKRTAQRLQELVENESMEHHSSEVASYITVSQGVLTVRPKDDVKPEELLQRVDIALYNAKGSGRNTICVAHD